MHSGNPNMKRKIGDKIKDLRAIAERSIKKTPPEQGTGIQCKQKYRRQMDSLKDKLASYKKPQIATTKNGDRDEKVFRGNGQKPSLR